VRQRATAIVFRGTELLLVKERGAKTYSLPGGEIKHGESSIIAAVRELREELHIEVMEIIRLRHCDFTGHLNRHHVCKVSAIGDPKLNSELEGFIWCDISSPFPVHISDSTKTIMNRYNHLVEPKYIDLFDTRLFDPKYNH
jgi:8-oxo-dGTP pyrophosphatase MutT (NUDIX family)